MDNARKGDWRQKDRERAYKEQQDHSLVSEIIVGSIQTRTESGEDTSTSVIVGNARIIREMNTGWENIAVMGWDGLIRPVCKDKGDGGLPQYATYITNKHKSNSKGAQPPLTYTGHENYNLDIRIDHAEPLVHPDFSHHGTHTGHDWDLLARHPELSDAEDYHLSMEVEERNGYDPYSDDARFMALRGPILMQGWGYDIDGKPVPNKADTYEDANNGIYADTDLTDEFMEDWLKKSSTWPVAPIDLRFDRARGLWVSPPAYKLIRAIATENITGDQLGDGYQFTGEEIYGSDGTVIPLDTGNGLKIRATCGDIDEDDKLILYYDVESEEYWPLCNESSATKDRHYLAHNGIPRATKSGNIISVGCAVCERMDFDPVGKELAPSGVMVEVYNTMPTAVDTGHVVNTQIEKGVPVVIVDPCEDYETGQGFSSGFSGGFG